MKRKQSKQTQTKCYSCGKPIRFIKQFDDTLVKVECKPFYYRPKESGMDYMQGTTVIDAHTRKQRDGIPCHDGLKGYIPHECI